MIKKKKFFRLATIQFFMITIMGKSIFFKLYRRPLFVSESERLPLINKRLEETRRYKFVPDSKLFVFSNNNKWRHFTKTASAGLANHLGTFSSALIYQASTILYVRSACKLRARRTECKSVFFQNDKLLAKDRGLSGLKGRGFGDSATCRPSEYHWKTIVNI